MTYEWRLNVAPSNSWWSLEEVAEAVPPPDALREFKLHVMDALDHEFALELRAHKLRQELHAELDDVPLAATLDTGCVPKINRQVGAYCDYEQPQNPCGCGPSFTKEPDDDPTAC